MMTCNEALELLSAQLDGALTPNEAQALKAHLETCPECRAIQKELAAIDLALPELEQEPPRLLHDAVMQEIRRETRKKKERRPLLRFVGVMAAAAALLAVLAGFDLIRLPGFDHGEAAVSMGDSLFPKENAARQYAKALSEETGCRVLLVERCGPDALSGSFELLENGVYCQKTTEYALDQAEAAIASRYPMYIAGVRQEAEQTAYLLCTDES